MASKKSLNDWAQINTARYYEFIQSIIDKRGQWAIEDEYYEGHHIIPKSFGGTGRTHYKDDNIVRLYAKEHYEAHKILAEDNPQDFGLVSAWTYMAFPKTDTQQRDFFISAEEYEIIRKTFGEAKHNLIISEETRQKMSQVRKGVSNGPFSEEHKAKISESNKHPHNISDQGLETLRNNSRNFWASLSEEESQLRKEKCRQRMLGKKWYTNGIIDKRCFEPPEGFVEGRTNLPNNQHSKGRHLYNNGVITVCRTECPEGFVKGKVPKPSNKSNQNNKGD